jgi:hypothetical protein
MANWVPYREEARGPKWQKFVVNYLDLGKDDTTHYKDFFALPAGGIIQAVKIKHSTAFGGGAISAYTIAVGISGTPAKYSAAYNVFQAVSATRMQVTGTVGQESHTAAVAIRATATSTTANLDAATAGVAEIWILWSRCD